MRRLYHDYYFCRQDELWRQNALKTLPALLNSSDMLACGEDLGFIPSCVFPVRLHSFRLPALIEKFASRHDRHALEQVMQELGLIGLRIQRMAAEPGVEFGLPSQYSYMTVCLPPPPSSHLAIPMILSTFPVVCLTDHISGIKLSELGKKI